MTMAKNDGKVSSEAGVVCREFIDDRLLDQLLASSSGRGLALTGDGGLLPELIKAVLTDHLGYGQARPGGAGFEELA